MPIFPLKVFLLPEGKIRLRIFEAKYIKMISIASRLGGFIIAPNISDVASEQENWGSFVNIDDFNQGADGVLEIDVHCQYLVKISKPKVKDELTFAEKAPITHWAELDAELDFPLSNLATSLDEIIVKDKMLSSLYQVRPLRNKSWVIARWLELLPINIAVKEAFINKHGYEQAKGFVESIIYE